MSLLLLLRVVFIITAIIEASYCLLYAIQVAEDVGQ